jgi:hypothetical protein
VGIAVIFGHPLRYVENTNSYLEKVLTLVYVFDELLMLRTYVLCVLLKVLLLLDLVVV